MTAAATLHAARLPHRPLHGSRPRLVRRRADRDRRHVPLARRVSAAPPRVVGVVGARRSAAAPASSAFSPTSATAISTRGTARRRSCCCRCSSADSWRTRTLRVERRHAAARFQSRDGLGRILLLASTFGIVAAGLTIMTVGMTTRLRPAGPRVHGHHAGGAARDQRASRAAHRARPRRLRRRARLLRPGDVPRRALRTPVAQPLAGARSSPASPASAPRSPSIP